MDMKQIQTDSQTANIGSTLYKRIYFGEMQSSLQALLGTFPWQCHNLFTKERQSNPTATEKMVTAPTVHTSHILESKRNFSTWKEYEEEEEEEFLGGQPHTCQKTIYHNFPHNQETKSRLPYCSLPLPHQKKGRLPKAHCCNAPFMLESTTVKASFVACLQEGNWQILRDC